MDGSLIDVGKLAEPATRLIEKISDAMGWVMKPVQIQRIARAEADANKIELLSGIELHEIQRRTLERWAVEEVRKQSNMESIAAVALAGVSEEARPEDMEDDWVVNFFEAARLISDEEMQRLWARVLAGEANSPGSFSKRAVNLLASFSREDAEYFTCVCRYVWDFAPGSLEPLIYNYLDPIYSGLPFDLLTHLEAIGLLHFDTLRGYRLANFAERGWRMSYFGRELILESRTERDIVFNLGQVMLSEVGKELCQVCSPKEVPGFEDYLLPQFLSAGYNLSTALALPETEA